MISIVIPLFNKAPYIGRALDSIMAQTYSEWECIVVDDGSTDGSLDVVSQYQDSRIKVIRQTNGGPSAARNRGAEEANGDWIALLDADDYWLPDHLSVLVQLMDLYPDCDVVASNIWREDTEGNRIALNRFHSSGPSSVHEYIEFVAEGLGALVSCSSAAVRKTTWREVSGFRCEFRLAEDVDFWCRISLRTKFAAHHKPTVVYFQDTSGRSTRTCLYVGDAPFAYLREEIPSHRREAFELYLAKWRVKSLALGTLLSGQKQLVRRMLLESMPYMRSGKILVLLTLSFLPTGLCQKLYALYRKAMYGSSERRLLSVNRDVSSIHHSCVFSQQEV